MIARGELGHHAAVGAVQLDLAEEPVRQQARVLIEHRRGAFVTGGFDGEHAHERNSTAVAARAHGDRHLAPRCNVMPRDRAMSRQFGRT